MKALVIFVSLAGTAGLWGWALLGETEPPALPPELVGRFELFDYRAATAEEANPVAEGRTLVYDFSADCTYTLRVLLDGETEMARFGGTIVPGKSDEVVLTGVAENARAADGESERFRVIWAYDENGEYLNLTQLTPEGEGRQLLLRKK